MYMLNKDYYENQQLNKNVLIPLINKAKFIGNINYYIQSLK